jgi:hypothetical protein
MEDDKRPWTVAALAPKPPAQRRHNVRFGPEAFNVGGLEGPTVPYPWRGDPCIMTCYLVARTVRKPGRPPTLPFRGSCCAGVTVLGRGQRNLDAETRPGSRMIDR